MKTVTVKGKVYQINQPYRNVSNGLIGYLCEDAFTAGERFMLSILPNYKKERGGELMFAVQIEPFTAGTIEGAPIELEKGEWYMCEHLDGQHNSPYKYLGDSDKCVPVWSHNDDWRSGATHDLAPLHKMGEIK